MAATYRGVPLEEIRIASVSWAEDRAVYIRSRSARKPGDRDVEPEWATEAATDERALIAPSRPPEGTDYAEGKSLEVLGFSASAGAVLKVWLQPLGIEAGEWEGVNACFAGRSAVKRYEGSD